MGTDDHPVHVTGVTYKSRVSAYIENNAIILTTRLQAHIYHIISLHLYQSIRIHYISLAKIATSDKESDGNTGVGDTKASDNDSNNTNDNIIDNNIESYATHSSKCTADNPSDDNNKLNESRTLFSIIAALVHDNSTYAVNKMTEVMKYNDMWQTDNVVDITDEEAACKGSALDIDTNRLDDKSAINHVAQ